MNSLLATDRLPRGGARFPGPLIRGAHYNDSLVPVRPKSWIRRIGWLYVFSAVLAIVTRVEAAEPVYHTTDTNDDRYISLNELTRAIELYNTRHGTVRTGAYKVDPANTEDGFAADSDRLPSEAVTLIRYYSADTDYYRANPLAEHRGDGQIDLLELTRVIELYNTRAGTVRTGEYHESPNTEDGFAAGPPGGISTQTITFPEDQFSGKTVFSAPIDLSATTTATGLTVQFRKRSGPFILNGNQLVIAGPGTARVEAYQVGNANFYSALPVVREFAIAAANDGTLGDDRSIWRHVNQDGILDEIIRPNTSRFRVSLVSINPVSGLPPEFDLNNYWQTGNLTEGNPSAGGTLHQNFRWYWSAPENFTLFPDSASVALDLQAEADFDYIILDDLNNGAGTDAAAWSWDAIATRPLHRFPATGDQHVDLRGHSRLELLNSCFYLIRLGKLPVINNDPTSTGTVGNAFSFQITALYSPTGYSSTALPAGLSLDTGTGLITGFPTTTGTTVVTISATNGSGTGPSATLTIAISPIPGTPIITLSEPIGATLL